MERLLGRPVQAVVLDRAPVDLIHRVLRDGRLAHESDRSPRIAFEVAARREYLDPAAPGPPVPPWGGRAQLPDPELVEEILRERLDDLTDVAAAVRGRLDG